MTQIFLNSVYNKIKTVKFRAGMLRYFPDLITQNKLKGITHNTRSNTAKSEDFLHHNTGQNKP